MDPKHMGCGEFNPIDTSVPGIRICEEFPRIAKMMDKFAPIRSMVGSDGSHAAFTCLTGWSKRAPAPQGGRPALGSVLSKLYGCTDPSAPPFVGLSPKMGHVPWSDAGSPEYRSPPSPEPFPALGVIQPAKRSPRSA